MGRSTASTTELYFAADAGTLTSNTNGVAGGDSFARGINGVTAALTMDGGTYESKSLEGMGFGANRTGASSDAFKNSHVTATINVGATLKATNFTFAHATNKAQTGIGLGAWAGDVGADTATATMDINGGTVSAPKIVFQAWGTNTVNIRASGATSGVLAVDHFYAKTGGDAGDGVHGSFVNFDGGTLKALESSFAYIDFMTGLTKASVLEGGAIIDTNTFDVTVSQALLHGGALATDGGLIKAGAGVLNSTGVNTYTGDTKVQAGSLLVSNAGFNDASSIWISSGAKMGLAFSGSDTVAALYLDGVAQASGTWGTTGSGAANINDVYFSANTGVLNVAAEPSTLGLLGMSLLGILAYAWRKRS